MKTAHSTNPYDKYNYILFKSLLHYDSWRDTDFGNAITTIEALPKPHTTHHIESLKASRLGETLSNFVRKIERTPVAPQALDSFRSNMNVKAERIERLWAACRPIAACFDLRGYVALIRVAIKEKAFPSNIESMFRVARANQVTLSPGYFEGLLAIGVREAIKERDLKQLELAFARAEACDLQFQTFNWGAFAKEACEVEDEYVFEVIWSKSGPSQFAFNVQTWVTFADAAGQVERADLIEQILESWLIHGDLSEGAVWGAFANAVARVHNEDLFVKIWKLAEPFKQTFTSITWGAMAKAAGRIGRGDLLETIWESLLSSELPLSSSTLGPFSKASGDTKQGELLERIWETRLKSDIELDGFGWGSFAHGAGHTNRPDLLKAIFNSWVPKPNTLLEGEHKTWSTCLANAFHLGDEQLFIEMFRRLAQMVDPVRLRNWGTVSDLLWKLAPRLVDREIAAEVTETLSGLRMNTSHCFNILATCEPTKEINQENKPFEGACRCLMRWLVNSYFFCPQEEFRARLSYLVDSLLGLQVNRERAWLEFLCRSQETYFGCLKSIYYRSYNAHTSFVEKLSDDELLDEIRVGRITKSIIEFEREGLSKISIPATHQNIPPDAPVSRLMPFLEYLWSNQRMLFVEKKLGDKETYFAEGARLLAQAEIETLSKEDWVIFLNILLTTMSQRIWEMLISRTPDNIHNLKNSFYWTFQMPLVRGEVREDERQEFARYAKQFLANLGNIIGKYSFGETKPISIASLVKARLLAGSCATAVDSDITTPFRIAAWDGARNDILFPLLKELRFNADKALMALPEEQRLYRVSLKNGEEEDSGFGILTVSNAYGDVKQDDISTGLGRAIVQKLAASLGGGAESIKEEHNGVRMFTWKVYLPRWTGPVGAE